MTERFSDESNFKVSDDSYRIKNMIPIILLIPHEYKDILTHVKFSRWFLGFEVFIKSSTPTDIVDAFGTRSTVWGDFDGAFDFHIQIMTLLKVDSGGSCVHEAFQSLLIPSNMDVLTSWLAAVKMYNGLYTDIIKDHPEHNTPK